jgi:hypothetical protein
MFWFIPSLWFAPLLLVVTSCAAPTESGSGVPDNGMTPEDRRFLEEHGVTKEEALEFE